MVYLAAGFLDRPDDRVGKIEVWEEDPVMGRSDLRRAAAASPAMPGHRAARRRKRSASTSFVDMYAKAVQGMAPEASVKWAHEELVKIYA